MLNKQARVWSLIILMIPPLIWAGNFIVGRAMRDDVPPVALAFWRWVIGFLCLLPFAWPAIRREYRQYWQYKWVIFKVALTGFAAFNVIIYLGLQYTTAFNGVLFNSIIPILILVFGALFYHQPMHRFQVVGVLLSLLGVLTVILQGDWGRILTLSFSKGDLIILAGAVVFAMFSLWLREIPASFNRYGVMTVEVGIAVIILFPLYLWELAHGMQVNWTFTSTAAVFYVGIFASIVAYLFYAIGVARIGPARAGLFIHLTPIFGAIMSSFLLHESLHLFHVVGVLFIFAGIVCSNKKAIK